MILLITGATHTGKTVLAQKLVGKYGYACLSIDHLKMGLIRSGQTTLTPMDDDKLTDYLWPIVREMIKTAVENGQDLIVEGCYIPFDWYEDLEELYRVQIRYLCLIMTPDYIEKHFDVIREKACVVEQRLDDSSLSKEALISENNRNWTQCIAHSLPHLLIDDTYPSEVPL